MLESSLQKPSETKQEGLTAAEEQSLDTLMQSLDMSDDENEVEPMDLDSITQTLDLSEGEEGHDFNSEFGVWSVCGTRVSFELTNSEMNSLTNSLTTLNSLTTRNTQQTPHKEQLLSAQKLTVFSPVIGLHTPHSVYPSPTHLAPTGYKPIFSVAGASCFNSAAFFSDVTICVTFSFATFSSVDA